MAVSTVLFDFGGTLDSNGITWLDRFFPLYLKQGLQASREEFSKAFYDSDDHLASRFQLDDLGLEETLRLHVRSMLQILAPKNLDWTERIVQPFLYDSRDFFRRIRPILKRLKENHALGVVSNFYGNLEMILETEGLRSFFSAISDSGKLGFSKPAPEIFLYAMNKIGSGPANTWMVGDSIPRDMKGAETIGLSHAWLRGDRPAGLPPCCQQAKILNSLEELETCLKSVCLV
jgi:putative hydrolase of the HAD superfamily